MRSIALGLAASTVVLLGCQTAHQMARPTASTLDTRHPALVETDTSMARRRVYEASESQTEFAAHVAHEEEIEGRYDIDSFVADVVATHPSIDALAAAWQAAMQRYPQAIALDDPMFMAMTAPASLNSNTAEGAYALELRQKLPWFGKRALRGTVANDEAAVAAHELDDARLKVALLAQTAYIEYYLAEQQVELNAAASELVSQFHEIAQTRYRTNQ